jgi:tetratricopeptide (TPR) repeat protein
VKKHLQDEEGTPRVLVVLVDDLDRCKLEFRWRLLDAIQQLSDIPNLFFVLAVDLERLREAVEQTGDVVDPDFALEKYIQHSVTLPDMDREGFKSFVERLLQESSGKDPAARTIVENVQFLQNGLKELTPRSVKRCINTILFDLRRQVSGGVSNEERQQYLKERMLEYTWPAFHRKYFRLAKFPATIDEERLRRAFGTLETACMELAHTRDEVLFNFTLKRISETLHLEWESLDRRLISFLGIPPYWFTSIEKPLSVFSQLEPEWAPVKAPSQPQREIPVPVLEDPTEEFTKLYLRGEIAEANGNREETLRYAQAVYDLITQHRSYFQSQHADSVGNIAINAERFNDIALAARLYELALELNPEHSNNMQNYVDLIVMRPVPSRYDRAKELIERLKRPRHAQHRLERTLSLEAHLKAVMGEEPARIGAGELERLIVDFLAGPTQRKFVGLMSLLTEIQDYADMDPIAHAFFLAATTDEDRYLAVRAFADGLAPAKDTRYELLAMDIYRYLLGTTLSTGAMAEHPQVEHNLATLLYRHDYDDEAGRLWFEAYSSVPKNGAIQRAYELYLLRAGRPDLANDVAEGKPLKEMKLQEGTKPIPRQFFDEDIERWWEVPLLQ